MKRMVLECMHVRFVEIIALQKKRETFDNGHNSPMIFLLNHF